MHKRIDYFICMVQLLCLLQSLDAVPVGATHIIPVNEIQSSVVLRLQMVNVVCLGICSVGQYSNPTSHQQMKPVWQLIPTMTCMKQRQPLQHVKECLTGVPGLATHTALHVVCVHRLCTRLQHTVLYRKHKQRTGDHDTDKQPGYHSNAVQATGQHA